MVHGGEHRPVDVASADGLALCVVACEQAGRRPPAEHGGKFPGEVMRILHGGVQAQSSSRRMTMRGVAGEKHASVLIAVGEHAFQGPVTDLVHLHLQIRQFQQRTQTRLHVLFVDLLGIVGIEIEMNGPLF